MSLFQFVFSLPFVACGLAVSLILVDLAKEWGRKK
jgi:hypothetical protein